MHRLLVLVPVLIGTFAGAQGFELHRMMLCARSFLELVEGVLIYQWNVDLRVALPFEVETGYRLEGAVLYD